MAAVDKTVPRPTARRAISRPRPGNLARLAVCLLPAAILLLVGGPLELYVATVVVIYGIAAIGQDLLLGRAGLVSLGGAATMLVGAFVAAKLSTQSWAPFPVPLIGAALGGTVVGFIVGIPGLRFRGLYLILTTLALQFIVSFGGGQYQNSNPAGFFVTAPRFLGITISAGRPLFLVALVGLAIVAGALHGIYRRAPGRGWRAIMASDLAASVLGIDVVRWKLTAFALSSAITAFAGGIFAYLVGVISYQSFSLTLSINLVLMVFVGGIGSISGALLGSAMVTLLPYLFQYIGNQAGAGSGTGWFGANSATITTAVFGVVLVLVLLFEPSGAMGIITRVFSAAGRLNVRPGRRQVAPPGAAAPAQFEENAAPVLTAKPLEAGDRSVAVPSEPPMLGIRDLRVRYPTGALGVNGVSISVRKGSLTAIVGRNGAGKTSVLRAIAGLPSTERVTVSGHIVLDGAGDIAGWSNRRTNRAGLILVPERDKVFPTLTVREHLALVRQSQRSDDDVFDLFSSLRKRADSPARVLSGGERQMLAFAVAWKVSPRLLLVDELSLGLAPVVTQSLLSLLQQICGDSEMSVLVVEQNAVDAIAVSDYLYVMDQGQVVWSGPSADANPAHVTSAYLGVSG